MYLLDTNVCIHILSGKHQKIEQKFRTLTPADIGICSIVKAELFFGARHSTNIAQNLERLKLFFEPLTSLPFDDRSAEEYGQIREDLTATGNSIGPNDLLIAAIARAHDITLVTHNLKEFNRITGLRVEDWE